MTTLLDQKTAALQKANGVRKFRAAFKRNVARMNYGMALVTVAEVLEDNPEELRSMPVAELLGAVPRLGRVKVDALLRHAGASPFFTVGMLPERQRRLLVNQLRMRA